MEEFESAKRLKRVIVPIGATGGAAKKIWTHVAKDLATMCPHISRTDFDSLNDPEQTPKDIAVVVSRVITAADKQCQSPEEQPRAPSVVVGRHLRSREREGSDRARRRCHDPQQRLEAESISN